MSTPIRTIIVDDHSLFRRGISEVLEEESRVDIVGQASSGPEGVALCQKLSPDVVLMDVHMPAGGGVEAVRKIKGFSNPAILMLTVSDRDDDLIAAIQAGADGYLLKNIEADDLLNAIYKAATGQPVLAPEVTMKVMQAAARTPKLPKFTPLSPRETEVLKKLSKGATTAEIANSLVISNNTVKTHISKIFTKLESNNRAEAVAKAVSLGIIRVE